MKTFHISLLAIIAIVALVVFSTANFSIQTTGQASGVLRANSQIAAINQPPKSCEDQFALAEKECKLIVMQLRERIEELEQEVVDLQEDNQFTISQPTVITQPGTYTVIQDFTVPDGQIGIDVRVPEVVITLNGYTITGGMHGIKGGDAVFVLGGKFTIQGIIKGGVTQSTDTGILLGDFSRVEHTFASMTGKSNLGLNTVGGIVVGDNSDVQNVQVSDYYGDGIRIGSNSVSKFNEVTLNPLKGGTLGAGIYLLGDNSIGNENTVYASGSTDHFGIRVAGMNGEVNYNAVYHDNSLAYSSGSSSNFIGDIFSESTYEEAYAAITNPLSESGWNLHIVTK